MPGEDSLIRELEVLRQRWASRDVIQSPCLNNRACAVLVPLVMDKGVPSLLFEVRSYDLQWQPGDICFPGGVIEADDSSSKEAALRETREELEMAAEEIAYFGPLDYLESPVGVTIWPHLGFLERVPTVKKSAEIDHLFTVPLNWFREERMETAKIELATRPVPGFPADIPYAGDRNSWKRRRTYDVYYCKYNEYVIWGITGHIIKNFLEITEDMQKNSVSVHLCSK